MKTLIMGGTEFVSSSLAKYLVAKGYEIDIFTRGQRELSYDGINRHIIGDRRNMEVLITQISQEKYEYVFDISAYTLEDVQAITQVLNRERLKRYVFCSSGAVYKETKEHIEEDYDRGENRNWGKYGYDKYEAENHLFELFKVEGFPMTIFRPSYIYGEGNNLYREGYIFDRINSGKAIPIPNSEAATQFIHIEDLVKLFESSVHNNNALGKAYNASTSMDITWEELIRIAMKVMNKTIPIKKVEAENIPARAYFPFRDVTYLMNIEKVRADGLRIPKIDLYEGLKRSYEWYSSASIKLKDDNMNKIEEVLKI